MKKSIYLQFMIVMLYFIITFTALPIDNAELSMQTRSEREFRELEQLAIRCLQIKQVMHLREDYFLGFSECRTFKWFLSYAQHNFQPQVQSYILSSYSIHSPLIMHYSWNKKLFLYNFIISLFKGGHYASNCYA